MEFLYGLIFKSVRKSLSELEAELAPVPDRRSHSRCSSGIQPAGAGDSKDNEDEKKIRPHHHVDNYLRTARFDVRGLDLQPADFGAVEFFARE